MAELVGALSLGIDLGFGQPMEHVLRQCLIALRIADAAQLDEAQHGSVYYTSLLINVGCHTDAHEQAKWFGDDIAMKSTKYDYEWRSLRGAAATGRNFGAGNPPLHRFRLGLEFVVSGRRDMDEMLTEHAQRARLLAEQLGLSEGVLDGVVNAYEQWDGKGWPDGRQGETIPIATRVATLAEFMEVTHRVNGTDAACAMARFIDVKSPYMLGHSRGVADLASTAGEQLGLGEAEVRTLRRAGLVHGFGRLGVSNSIWDKRGPLGAGEWERVRIHPYFTERMLQQSPALAPLGQMAVQLRERLDGSGYPRGLPANAIGRPARILAAADVYQAMCEPRPHRDARAPADAAAQLRDEVRAGRLDGDAAEAVLSAAGHRVRRRREGPAGLTAREVEVLRLLAQGLSNKEIAQRLVISPKTAGNHIEHIYAKIGTSSRATASLFAMQHGLLPEDELVAEPAVV